MEAPVINIGILTGKAILFVFNTEYVHTATGTFLTGEQRALFVNGKILFNSRLYDEVFFEPAAPAASFDLKAVTIGLHFHWQRQEDLRFRGALNLVAGGDGIVTINQVDAEEYLTSVISSEMNATASKEFLKAHAVISRSWLLAQVEKKIHPHSSAKYRSYTLDKEQLIHWYDREDHTYFDVCADDHCQRYQGITRIFTPAAQEAVRETRGEILTHDNRICDTRFSKCCGGVTEQFESCWEPVPHPYLTALRDAETSGRPDLTLETEAEKWIRNTPDAFCHTTDKSILNQVLTHYDQETPDFFRWKVVYTQKQLAELIREKSGMDFGRIIDLIPLERGTSGRLIRLRILGTRRNFVIGKELEIRRILSESHLYSSAFVVDKAEIVDGIPQRFVLTGAGWGHGVGLCQIGAAVMGAKGYSYKEILKHYFPGAELEQRY